MFKNIKKRATTVFRKKRAPDTTAPDLPPENNSVDTATTTTTNTNPDPNPPFRFSYSTPTTTTTTEPDPRTTTTDPLAPPSPPSLTHPLEEVATTPPEEEEPIEDSSVVEDRAIPPPDPFARKYVPYIEASPLKNNMLSNAGVYGRINPDIMGGFGDEDDDEIWLVDDEETDEEQQRENHHEDEAPPKTLVQPQDRDNSDHRSETRSHRSRASQTSSQEIPIVLAPPELQDQLPDAPAPDPARPAFTYNKPTLLDDDEFATFTTTGTNTEETPRQPTPPPAVRRGYAPISSSILDLANLGIDDDLEDPPKESPKPRAETPPQQTIVDPPASSSISVNPYVALFEQQDYAMTVAYLRRLDQSGDELADDFRFGQRYQKSADTPDVIVTHQRVPAKTVIGDLDCVVCADTKGVEFFPRFSITSSCTHSPNTCLECVQLSIESDLNNKLWTEIRCPECREMLEYTDIQRYANKQTFMRYETLALRAAMSEADNFVWCTSGCGSGQIHESGDDQPIVTCLHCNHRSCFHHSVPWHENLSCEEYDRLLADPENFRSRLELENEAWSESQRAQLEADRQLAQNLLADDQAEMQRREERARKEREQARKAAELVRQIAARRKREEQQSQATVSQTTQPCPGCGWAIEKNDGCSHMTCVKCRHQFCFECGANHEDIVANDNTAHKETCKFHPDNMEFD